jgi:uncharacterized protein (DUF2252 family)
MQGDAGMTRADRLAAGKALRTICPRRAHAEWQPAPDRPDPVDLVVRDCEGRREDLIPIRIGRMAASPFAFLRGAASQMAADLAGHTRTSMVAQVCGDAHCANFGVFASPERTLVLDVNDFDETDVGPWETDLLRLAASLHVLGRENGYSEAECGTVVERSVAAYRDTMWRLAEEGFLALQYSVTDAPQVIALGLNPKTERVRRKVVEKATTNTSDRQFGRLTEVRDGGRRRFLDQPPLLGHVSEAEEATVRDEFARYLGSLPPQWREALRRYGLADVAFKVVGVGSVGLRAYVLLLVGNEDTDVIVMQLKQARVSILAWYGGKGARRRRHQGRRVVEGQKIMQAVHDPLLGWTGTGAYVRQLADWKGQAPLLGVPAVVLADLGRIRGTVLAKAHARSVDPAVLAGYIGRTDRMDRSVAVFARRYADQTEADHAALVGAISAGRVQAEMGV